MENKRALTLQPIGRVVRGRPWDAQGDRWEKSESEIELDASWVDTLDGIDGFSHIWVVWWVDRFPDPPASPRVRPEGRTEMPLVGILATRSPHRPNPLGITVVHLLERRGARLRVAGLDACEDTPVLDIKPYLRRGDMVPEARMPEWLEELWRIHDSERDS